MLIADLPTVISGIHILVIRFPTLVSWTSETIMWRPYLFERCTRKGDGEPLYVDHIESFVGRTSTGRGTSFFFVTQDLQILWFDAKMISSDRKFACATLFCCGCGSPLCPSCHQNTFYCRSERDSLLVIFQHVLFFAILKVRWLSLADQPPGQERHNNGFLFKRFPWCRRYCVRLWADSSTRPEFGTGLLRV